MKKLSGRVAVVTGAASGIGRETALLLAQRGCVLCISDIDAEGLAQTEALLRQAGAQVRSDRVDVSDKARMERYAEEVVAAHGGVHIVVNNAGVTVLSNFREHTIEDFEWLFGVNFWGVVYGCKFFLPHLLKADEAHIVNVSSVFGLIGVPQQTSYCASKFAVRGFTESLRIELGGSSVGITSVHPGGFDTRIVADMRVNDDVSSHKRKKFVVRQFKKFQPASNAARKIVSGIERNQSRVLIANETYVVDGIKRLAPVAITDLAAWSYHRLVPRLLRG